MKKFLMMVMMVAVMFQGAALAETYAVAPNASMVEWEGTKVTGKHYGSISVTSGTIDFDAGKFTGGEAVIDMSSIVVEDITDPGSNKKLTDHLKSSDFFDVSVHPEASMKVTGVESTGENTYQVTADFTIKGITHPVTFPASVVMTGGGVEAEADIVIDRSKYNVRYGSGTFFENLGDRMIHDEFTLSVYVQAAEA